MAVLRFLQSSPAAAAPGSPLDPSAAFPAPPSLEVMPRTAARIDDFRKLLPAGTRIYLAHIDGTDIADLVATARRLAAEGFRVVPHLPARSLPDREKLADLLARYRGEAGVCEALVLGGGRAAPVGAFAAAGDLLRTGLLDSFVRIDIAGHPEGNRDIDPHGGGERAMTALREKAEFAAARGIEMTILTQFAFAADPVLDWAEALEPNGIALPVHVGIAGPARLQTLIRYAISCGVGASLGILQRRARDVTRLVRPFEPDDLVRDLARARSTGRARNIAGLHVFPLGGVEAAAGWLLRNGLHPATVAGK